MAKRSPRNEAAFLVALSPDGKKRAAIKSADERNLGRISWDISPDGRRLCFAGQPADVNFFSAASTRNYLWMQELSSSRSTLLHAAYSASGPNAKPDYWNSTYPSWHDNRTLVASLGPLGDYASASYKIRRFDLNKPGFVSELRVAEGRPAHLEDKQEIYGALSPDGHTLLYVARSIYGRGTDPYYFLKNPTAYLVSRELSTGKERILRTVPDASFLSHPRWRPDGRAWAWNEAGTIWKESVDGQPQQLTDGKTWCQTPEWSPDGKRLAFLSKVGDNELLHRVYLMNADGSNAHCVASDLNAETQQLRWLAVTPSARFRKVPLDLKARPTAKK